MMLAAHRRIKLKNVSAQGPPLYVNVQHLQNPEYDRNSDIIKGYQNVLAQTLQQVVQVCMYGTRL